MKEKIFILFIFLFIFSACKKQVDKERLEFIGMWYSQNDNHSIYFNISQDSHASYQVYEGMNNEGYSGIARANDHHLKIGRIMKFEIIEYPHEIDTATDKHDLFDYIGHHKLANWRMVLNGINPLFLNRYQGKLEYYKADY